ncbi:MAG: ATP-binding protein [Caldilineaceae bacterium]
MPLQKLPIGIQTFSEIINGNYLYVDKTRHIHRLLTTGKFFFLSRPRRFGKSLTLSTIASIYRGERELFEGLWIAEQWEWQKVQPVLHISFSSVDYQGLGLEEAIKQMLTFQAAQYDVVLESETIKSMWAELIRKLAQNGKVVILIDEYDKPIIDFLENKPQAIENRQILKTFYSVVKDSDPYIEFMLLTGVSKFSKVSIFSELNNLNDISLDRRFADLTGYTQAELERSFVPHMEEAEQILRLNHSELLAQLRHWYNGYSWDGEVYVYNPFSVLSFLQKVDFRNFWFETGTPTFLLKLLREQWLFKLENLTVSEQTFASYDIEHLEAIAILFQTGYLTIKERREFGLYVLDYPNAEVKESLLSYIIADLRNAQTPLTKPMVIQLYEAFYTNDLEQVIALIKSIFKNIPSHIFLSQAEAYYHSLIYLVFFYLGQYTESEVNTNDGRLDCVIQTPTHIYILEFKLDQSAEEALKQIKDKGYADKYAADPRPKVLLGINFSRAQKTVDGWLMEVSQ